MKEEIQKYFAQVEDPRSVRNQKHPFVTLVGTTLLGCLGGQDSFSGIADFVQSHLESLMTYFEFPHGVPSHDTYQRLWDALDPIQFSGAFHVFTQTLAPLTAGVISMDGKTIRHSGKGHPFQMVSAFCEANQLVFAHQKVEPHSNEITAIPKLLGLLELTNRIVTIDAIGAQTSICQQILDQQGDYLIALKNNQRTLREPDFLVELKQLQNLALASMPDLVWIVPPSLCSAVSPVVVEGSPHVSRELCLASTKPVIP